ncbi:MAG: peptidylprolyl isomerase [Bacteroidia bacterium]|nr:peptidylprolyl isomerase [Bacteroidia bacterium]
MNLLKNFVLAGALLAMTFSMSLGQETVDKIIAVIGEDIILQSDVDNQYNYLIINGQKDNGTMKCQVMENLIVSKLMLNKARQDSIEVSDAEVDGELDRRISTLLRNLDPSQFTEIYGKSVAQFRQDIREDIKNELLIQRMQGVIEADTDITPNEVKKFFAKIPEDSLGLLPAEVQVNHIVIKPPYSDESRKAAKELLIEVREKVLDEGADFGELAARYTDEPGGRQRKGNLGEFGRSVMVPEFENVVFNMRPGEVSLPFETEFGVHIVKLHERKGEVLTASHILKNLKVTTNGDSLAMDSLNKILDIIQNDTVTFEQAAMMYSQDRLTRFCGGCISNPQTQELRIPMDALDAEMYFKVDEMKSGEISKPMEYTLPTGEKAFHIVYLKNKIRPHRPNLSTDYQKIRNAALLAKRSENFENWLERAKKNIYIDIKPTECQNALQNWLN